MVKLICHALV